MAIASLNINGIPSHLDEVKLMMKRLGIHILALKETKLDNSVPKELTKVSGYQQIRLYRTSHGGGISIYVRDSINFKPRDDIPIDGLELICIETEPRKSKPFLVIAWYRPPSDLVGSFDKLEKALAFLDREGKEVILLGDTNCDLTGRSSDQLLDKNAKHMADIYELFSSKHLVGEPTRVTLETETLIDHIATTCARNIVKTGVHEVSLSDHFLVYCIRKFNGAVEKGHKRIKPRSRKHFKEDEFLSDVSDICWEHFFQQIDYINKLVDDWSALFALIIEKHAPLREVRVSEKYCPWINKDLKSLMQTKDRLKKAALKSKSTVLMDSYRQARNKVNSVNIKLKKQYFSTKISECKGNMKESWKTINEVLNKRSKSCNIDCIKDSGNAIVNKKRHIECNEYFLLYNW